MASCMIENGNGTLCSSIGMRTRRCFSTFHSVRVIRESLCGGGGNQRWLPSTDALAPFYTKRMLSHESDDYLASCLVTFVYVQTMATFDGRPPFYTRHKVSQESDDYLA